MYTLEEISDAVKNGTLAPYFRDDTEVLTKDQWDPHYEYGWTRLLPLVYETDASCPTLQTAVENAIKILLLGSPHDVFCGFATLFAQLFNEIKGRSPFFVDREPILQMAAEGLSKYAGVYDSVYLDEINRYKRLFRQHLDIDTKF